MDLLAFGGVFGEKGMDFRVEVLVGGGLGAVA